MILRRSVVLLVLAALTAAPGAAQDWSGSGRVKGTVTDLDGNPIEGAQVSYRMVIDPETGPPPFITNKKGRYSFLGIKGGPWWIRVDAEGYYVWKSPAPVDVYSSGVSDPVEVEMEKIPQEELVARSRYEANTFLEDGDAKADAGDFAGARADYEKALGQLEEVDYPVVLSSIAATYMNEGNIDEAKATLERALAIDPTHVSSLKMMCAIEAAQGNLEEAEALLAKIPEDEVLHPTTLMNMGLANFNEGNMDIAKVYMDRTIRDHPEVGTAYYYRGLIDLNLGDTDAAKADFEKFLELEPESPQAAEAKEYLSYLTGGDGS